MATNTDFADLHGRDPHAVLGVRRGATPQEVTRAFRRNAAQGGHPDAGGDDVTFRKLARARDILLDAGRIAAYDAARQTAQHRYGVRHSTTLEDDDPGHARQDSTESQGAHPEGVSHPVHTEAAPPTTAQPPGPLSKLAVLTLVLAFLGPLLWPVAIVVGHIAYRRIRRNGQRGDVLVSVTLVFLYLLTILVLPRLLFLIISAVM